VEIKIHVKVTKDKSNSENKLNSLVDEHGLTWNRQGDYWTLVCPQLEIEGCLDERYLGPSKLDPPDKNIIIVSDRALKYLDHVRKS
jgi:hypothetical protein